MREIIFKAKRIDNGEWVEGTPIFYKDGSMTLINVNEYKSVGYHILNNGHLDRNTLCQYTGLTDKNGNKIWENDVVKKHFYTDYDVYANSEEYVGAVEFEDYAWVIKAKRDNRVCVRPIIESIAYSEDVKHFEVIGNIFDNPELLEG